MMVAAVSGVQVPLREANPAYIMAIKALAHPQTLSRITGLFAQFGVIPTFLSCQHLGNFLTVDVQFDAASADGVELLLAKIQAMVVVERAGLVAR